MIQNTNKIKKGAEISIMKVETVSLQLNIIAVLVQSPISKIAITW